MALRIPPLRFITDATTVADAVKRACVDHARREARIDFRKFTLHLFSAGLGRSRGRLFKTFQALSCGLGA